MSGIVKSKIQAGLRVFTDLATHPSLRFIALLALCSVYLTTGIEKLLDFPGAVAEVRSFGVPMPTLAAVATIITELGGCALILSGWYRWFGALMFAGFTFIVNFVANKFWLDSSPHATLVQDAFLEHIGLVAAFFLVAWYDAQRLTNRDQSAGQLRKSHSRP